MNNETLDKTTQNFTSIMPKEVINKFGWILLVTPVVFHAIDKYFNFVMMREIMSNGYECSSTDFSLTQIRKEGVIN